MSHIDPDTGEFFPTGSSVEVPPVFLRTPFNYDTDAASLETGLDCQEPSLAQQQFRDEADINTIVRRFGLTGELPEQGAYPAYGDFETVNDYQTASNMVRAAAEAFMALPAPIRYRFGNDPQALMDFCADPANLPEARKLGLTRTLSQPPIETPPKPIQQVGAGDNPKADPPPPPKT